MSNTRPAAEPLRCFYCQVEIPAIAIAVLGPLRDALGKPCCRDCQVASLLFDGIQKVSV